MFAMPAADASLIRLAALAALNVVTRSCESRAAGRRMHNTHFWRLLIAKRAAHSQIANVAPVNLAITCNQLLSDTIRARRATRR